MTSTWPLPVGRPTLVGAALARPDGWSDLPAALDLLTALPLPDALRILATSTLTPPTDLLWSYRRLADRHPQLLYPVQAALAAHARDPAALHALRTVLAHPLTDMRAAGNLLTSPQEAAELLASVSDQARPATLRAAADTLAARPDLPLSDATCDRIVNRLLPEQHGLAVAVHAARRDAGLDAPVELVLPGYPSVHTLDRAAVVLARLAGNGRQPDPDTTAAAADLLAAAGEVPPALLAGPLDALRCDLLAEGPWGQRPRFVEVSGRFLPRLAALAGHPGRVLHRRVCSLLADSCAPDPPAAAALAVHAGTNRHVVGSLPHPDTVQVLRQGIPWWPQPFECATAAAARQCAATQPDPELLEKIAGRGLLTAAILDNASPAAAELAAERWVPATGHMCGPHLACRRPPPQVADAELASRLRWPSGSRLAHDLNAFVFAGTPAPSGIAERLTVSDADGITEGVLPTLSAVFAEAAAPLRHTPRSVAAVVGAAAYPGRSLAALAAVA